MPLKLNMCAVRLGQVPNHGVQSAAFVCGGGIHDNECRWYSPVNGYCRHVRRDRSCTCQDAVADRLRQVVQEIGNAAERSQRLVRTPFPGPGNANM